MASSLTLKQQIESLSQRIDAVRSMDDLEPLVEEARSLLHETFQTDAEEDVRKLFRALQGLKEGFGLTGRASSATETSDERQDRLARRIRAERTRLTGGGSLIDMELAVDGLFQVLREVRQDEQDSSLRKETLEALEAAGQSGDPLRERVREMFESQAKAQQDDVAGVLRRLERPDGADDLPTTARRAVPLPGSQDAEVVTRLSAARRLFYAGEYYEAADALTLILRLDPDNQEARDRLAQVEDSIRRGIVPDSRVPFEARTAFGRAQSLERAGRFEEARESYRLALIEARTGGPLLQNWQPAVEALLRIDNSIIARATRDEGDVLLREDKWREAIEKYEIVLDLLPEDIHARERARSLGLVMEQAEVMRALFNTAGDDLSGACQSIVVLQRTLHELRTKLTGSQRFTEMEAEVNTNLQALKKRIVDRGKELISRARFLPDMDECRRLMKGARPLLDLALQLTPNDAEVADLKHSVSVESTRLEQAGQQLAEARRFVNLNTDTGRQQALDALRNIREYDQDPAYLQLVGHLQRQLLDVAEALLGQNDLKEARHWLTVAEADPFTLLGQSEEIWQLEQELIKARRRPLVRGLGWGGGALVVLVAGYLLFRPPGVFGSHPAPTSRVRPTETVTATEISTAPPTPGISPTSFPTPTQVPAFTATHRPSSPTLTATPLVAPSPLPRFGAISQDSAARLSPDPLAPWAFTLRAADPVQVLDESRDATGRLWYKILYIRGDSMLVGWAQATDVNVMPTLTP